jgi:hypothetical protein
MLHRQAMQTILGKLDPFIYECKLSIPLYIDIYIFFSFLNHFYLFSLLLNADESRVGGWLQCIESQPYNPCC